MRLRTVKNSSKRAASLRAMYENPEMKAAIDKWLNALATNRCPNTKCGVDLSKGPRIKIGRCLYCYTCHTRIGQVGK